VVWVLGTWLEEALQEVADTTDHINQKTSQCDLQSL